MPIKRMDDATSVDDGGGIGRVAERHIDTQSGHAWHAEAAPRSVE